MMIKIYIVFTCVFAICIFSRSCSQVEFYDSIADKNSNTEKLSLLPKLKIPMGNEIKIEVTNLKPKKAIVTVHNISSEDIFLPYLPGLDDDWAYFACLGLKKKNPKTEEFISIPCGDFAFGSHPLKAGKSFRYLLIVEESGIYQLNLNYMIDEQFYKYIREEADITSLELNEKIALATKTISAPVFKL